MTDHLCCPDDVAGTLRYNAQRLALKDPSKVNERAGDIDMKPETLWGWLMSPPERWNKMRLQKATDIVWALSGVMRVTLEPANER